MENKLISDSLVKPGAQTTTQLEILLNQLIKSNQNILIFGGAGSGKTTLLNLLAKNITSFAAHEKLTIIDGANEIKADNNQVTFLTPTTESYANLISSVIQTNPKYLIVGELRTSDAIKAIVDCGIQWFSTIHNKLNPKGVLNKINVLTEISNIEISKKVNIVISISPNYGHTVPSRNIIIYKVIGYNETDKVFEVETIYSTNV